MAWLVRRTYKVRLPDGTVERRKCDRWTIQYRDAAGRVCSKRAYSDKSASQQLAAKLQVALARGEQGLVDIYRAHKAGAFKDHVRDYVADLRATGHDELYTYNAEKRLAILEEGCGWKTLADAESNSFIRWRERQRAAKCKRRGHLAEKLSAETLNQYLRVARAFLNWCAQNGRIEGVPVKGRTVALALANVVKVEGPAVRKRRALTDDEAARLLAVAAGRAIVYRTGLAIGLRRQELDDLLWADLQLRAIRPYVQLRAEATKARRGDRLELPQSLAEALRRHKPAGAKDTDRVFPDGVPSIDQWRADLAAAGIPYKDGMGRQVDFHAGTRKTLCTRMHRSGRPLAEAMKVMRHTNAKLTMIDYTDAEQIGTEPLPELAPARGVPAAGASVGGA